MDRAGVGWVRRGRAPWPSRSPSGAARASGARGAVCPVVRGLLFLLSFINLKNNVMSPVLFIHDISVCLLSKQTIKLKCWEFHSA